MSNFEEQLRRALGRQEPPAGFAGRVMARIPDGGQVAPWWRFTWAGWASAAALVMIVVGGLRYHEYRKAEQAKEQFMLALEITAQKLALVERKIGAGRSQQ
jgi:hypothetical protein